MKTVLLAALTLATCGCSMISGLSNSCVENKADNSKICTIIDTNQNITTRSIEKDRKLFISTCSNGYCSEFKEINPGSHLPPAEITAPK